MKNTLNFWKTKIIYSDKRQKGMKNILASILTIIISLAVALLITCIIYKDFSFFYKIFDFFFTQPFSSALNVNTTISTIAIFSVAAIAFLIAMKCGLFNIGISGQMMFGAAVATVLAQHMINVPNGLSQLLLVLISVISAAAISTLIGVFKSFLNVNEVVSSIMFNWIIYFIATLMLADSCKIGSDGLQTLPLTTLSPSHNLVLQIFMNGTYVSWLPLLIIAIIVVAFAIVLLGYTAFGKKIINTGMSLTAARYAGYSTRLNQVFAMLISGAIAGILGAMVYLGKADNMGVTVAAKTIPQEGFTGISVGLIAMSNSWAILPIACLFGMIDGSKVALQTSLGVDPSISDCIFGIVVYGAAIISIFYYLVPFKWYLRIFKGKIYADNYAHYVNNVNKDLDDAVSLIHSVQQKKNISVHNSRKKIYKAFAKLRVTRKKEFIKLVQRLKKGVK
ncbi:MAG: ABC transporter permease [Mycoplasmataceae bacterium]|nr:ABC transporter permease [Mycoplasmataceae bacterium]